MEQLKKKNDKKQRNAIVILGPTASGKTAVSIELARHLKIEIISADSRQLYKYLDIGTAKPDSNELAAVPHHFIDHINPDEYYSAGSFGNEAAEVMDRIFGNRKTPVIVGGSGLYIKALCEGFFDEQIDKKEQMEVRGEIEARSEEIGMDKLYLELWKVDPVSAKMYKDKNPKRIVRALEYYELTGVPFSKAHEKNKQRNFNSVYFGIERDRQELYERINLRAEQMWRGGLIEEINRVLGMGYSKSLNSLNTVGYKEAISFLKGEMAEEDALEKMKRNTRRYAKRQMTWFSRQNDVTWLSGTPKEIAEKIYLKTKDIL